MRLRKVGALRVYFASKWNLARKPIRAFLHHCWKEILPCCWQLQMLSHCRYSRWFLLQQIKLSSQLFIRKRVERSTHSKRITKQKWVPWSINRLFDKYVKTGSTGPITGSGRPMTARKGENIIEIEDVVQSQEDRPGTHLFQRKIASKLKIRRCVVRNIIIKI